MTMDGSIVPTRPVRVHGIRYRRHFRGGGRLPMAIALFLAVWLAFICSYALSSLLTPKTATLPRNVAAPPAVAAPVQPAVTPIGALPAPLTPAVSTHVSTPHVVTAHAATEHVVPVAPTPHTRTPTPSTPQADRCGTVASLTQPVTSLLPGPLGGSSGVVQRVTCALP